MRPAGTHGDWNESRFSSWRSARRPGDSEPRDAQMKALKEITAEFGRGGGRTAPLRRMGMPKKGSKR